MAYRIQMSFSIPRTIVSTLCTWILACIGWCPSIHPSSLLILHQLSHDKKRYILCTPSHCDKFQNIMCRLYLCKHGFAPDLILSIDNPRLIDILRDMSKSNISILPMACNIHPYITTMHIGYMKHAPFILTPNTLSTQQSLDLLRGALNTILTNNVTHNTPTLNLPHLAKSPLLAMRFAQSRRAWYSHVANMCPRVDLLSMAVCTLWLPFLQAILNACTSTTWKHFGLSCMAALHHAKIASWCHMFHHLYETESFQDWKQTLFTHGVSMCIYTLLCKPFQTTIMLFLGLVSQCQLFLTAIINAKHATHDNTLRSNLFVLTCSALYLSLSITSILLLLDS